MVYDITNRDSFAWLIKQKKEIERKLPSGVQLLVLGNKMDLEGKRQVTEDEGQVQNANEKVLSDLETS